MGTFIQPLDATRRSRERRKIALSVALLLAAAAALIAGAFATFTNTATAGSQAITSGTIKLATGPTNDAATGASNIAAGDSIAREIDLNSTGSGLADKEITLKFTASPSSLLDTDPTNGLQLSIQACSVAWTRTVEKTPPPAFTYECKGSASTVKIGGAATASVSSLEATPAKLEELKSLAAGGQDYLVFKLELPAGAPGDLGKVVTPCSGTSGGTASTENLEGCSSTLTYAFQAVQRAGIPQ
jgi:spore coat-associated protein N